MSRMSGLTLMLLLAGCEPQVKTTFVNGSVNGVSIPAADAAALHDRNALGAERDTVLIGSHTGVCARAWTFGPFEPSGLRADGTRQPALVLTRGRALFDTGVGNERLTATASTFDITERDANFTRGHFTATFGSETLSGDFVALPCGNLDAGCSSAPGLMLLGLAAWLRRRASRT